MRKKRFWSVVLFVLAGLFIVGIFVMMQFVPPVLKSSAAGIVSLTILPPPNTVFIHSPENITYYFSTVDYLNGDMIIDLNVSANFDTIRWMYDLWEMERVRGAFVIPERLVYSEMSPFGSGVIFTPNTTFMPVRWGQRMDVYAWDLSSEKYNASVEFSVSVPNFSPTLGEIDDELFVCEGNDGFSFKFNATDIDEDFLLFDVSPKNPFFLVNDFSPVFLDITRGLTYAESATIPISFNESYARNIGWVIRELTLSVSDGIISDYRNVNVTIIEVNDAPVMDGIGNYSFEINSTSDALYIEFNVSDFEDGNQSDGKMSFNTNFIRGNEIFNVSDFGVVNLTLDSSHVGEYEVEVCVNDSALGIVHQNISLCEVGAAESKFDCQVFNLSITREAVVIAGPSGGGGGGGGGGGVCGPSWACNEWMVCQNLGTALEKGRISGEDYRSIKEECSRVRFGDEICGYQNRDCFDLNNCGKKMGEEIGVLQMCHYVENPTCDDGVKNCHDGGCEFLIDCGGPCEPCPSCSDGIQNQGEQEVDCGGPCPISCPETLEVVKSKMIYYSLWIVLILLILVLLVIWYRVRKLRKES
ncbi:MAG: hypothetical protein ABIG28_01510 [archaeon]